MEKSLETEFRNDIIITEEAHAEMSACASVAPNEDKKDAMEEQIFTDITRFFDVKGQDIRMYSPLTLAYIGDGIYDLVIRSVVVAEGETRTNQLHQHTSHLVKAHSQSEMMKYLQPILTEEEQNYFRRGRNAKSPTMAKNATMADYRRATGFEALMGYLYLTDQFQRMLELVQIGLTGLRTEEKKRK